MWTQPARVVSPPMASYHAMPNFDQNIDNVIARDHGPLAGSVPTWIPGMQRAAASNVGIESARQGNYMLVIPPDRYNALATRIRKARDVRSGFLQGVFSRRRTPAPAVGA